ncbi:hypothetical protein MMC25_002286 [Agyrium rufum]|nr:hypothetical protein [Agyrium rufum]
MSPPEAPQSDIGSDAALRVIAEFNVAEVKQPSNVNEIMDDRVTMDPTKVSDEGSSAPSQETPTESEVGESPQGETKPKPSPAILYKLEYSNENNEIIHEEQREHAYIDIKEEEEVKKDTEESPIIEIVTSVTAHNGIFNSGIIPSPPTREDVQRMLQKFAEDEELTRSGAKPFLRIRNINSTKMVIKSVKIINALRSVVEYYPSQSLSGEIVSINSPYAVLIHHRDELEKLCRAIENGGTTTRCPKHEHCTCLQTVKLASDAHEEHDLETAKHLRIMLDFLDTNFKKKNEAERQRWSKKPGTATYDMLWLLLKPGTRCYTEVDGELAGFVVRSCEPFDITTNTSWSVRLWSLDFDGQFVRRKGLTVVMFSFEGEKDINSLKIIPMEYKDLEDPNRQIVIRERGEHFYKVIKAGFEQAEYNGDSLGQKRRRYKGRVILDPSSYYQTYDAIKPDFSDLDDDSPFGRGGCSCASCEQSRRALGASMKKPFRYSAFDSHDPKVTVLGEEDRELMYSLLPRAIPGFVMKERTWQILDITLAKEKKTNSSLAIASLAMPTQQLDLIKALSAKYSQTQATWSADFIASKGEGQIFLLHGPPGVGKTFTAESIAEYTGRPLLALTCADIGIDETKMESQLGEWFALAETWGAVMLVDEADVYLEKRETGDLQRNSLVSAFLRSMEYYRGILFLTTNRVGHMDPAIMSRVHVVLKYNPLNDDQRKKIWKQFVEKLEKDREDIYIDDRAWQYITAESTMKRVVWNGREIRNAFQTAVALAEYDANAERSAADGTNLDAVTSPRSGVARPKVNLRKKHFQQVVEMSYDFKNWFDTCFGTEASRAQRDGARFDGDLKPKTKGSKKGGSSKRKEESEESDDDV